MSAVGATAGTRPALGADVLPGLTTAAVVIPKALAYATIAGLPIEVRHAVRRSPLDERVGLDHMFFNVETAVARLQEELGTTLPQALPQEAST